MSVQLNALKIFCDVVRQRSFSRAAAENGISQSGASQVVNQLEKRLNVKLIDRSKRPFVLTPEGDEYYEGCRVVVERYFALEDRVQTLHQEVVGRVRVASIYSVGLHHMNRYLQRFLTAHPKANVRLEYLHPDRVYQSVEDDVADIGLISYPKPSRTLQAIQWRTEPMVLVTAPGHRLAAREQIGLAELQGERLIGFDRDLTIRNEIDRVLNLHRVDVQVAMEFDNIETIKRAIEIDAGIGLLPEPTVLREVAAGSLVAVRLDTDELVRPLGIIHRRGKELSSTAKRFIELLQHEATFDESTETHQVSNTINLDAEGFETHELAVDGPCACGDMTVDFVAPSSSTSKITANARPTNANLSAADRVARSIEDESASHVVGNGVESNGVETNGIGVHGSSKTAGPEVVGTSAADSELVNVDGAVAASATNVAHPRHNGRKPRPAKA